MGVEQVYNPMAGIGRMIADVESFLQPIWYAIHPILHLISKWNVLINAIVLLGLIAYVILIKKHSIVRHFKKWQTYIYFFVALIVFTVLNALAISLSSSIKLNFGIIVMPVIAKFFGPVVTFLFGIGQYFVQFLDMQGQTFNMSAMLIGGISGIIYALFLYTKRTKYSRCFFAKLTVNVVCNMMLTPLAQTPNMNDVLAKFISDRLIENVVMVPFQALIIFIALKIIRKVQNRFQ